MGQCSTKWVYSLLLIFGTAALQACAPLTVGSNTTTEDCMASVISNNGAFGIGQIGAPPPPNTFTSINTAQLAQSFPATSANSFTIVSLNLDAVYPTGQVLSSFLHVDIEPDVTLSTTGNPSPTSPAGIAASLGTAQISTGTGFINTKVQGPSFVTFTFQLGISLTVGQIYWIVATPDYSPSATSYVEWRASNTALLNFAALFFTTLGNTWQSLGTTTNLDFKVGC